MESTMKKQDSLDDLIISENIGSNKGSGSSKSILTMIGLVLAVLIGAILLTKVVLEEPQKPKIPLEENLTNSALVQTDMNESNLSDINESMMIESNTSMPVNEEVNTSIKDVSASTNDSVTPPVVVPKKVVEKTIKKDSVKKLLPVKNKVNTQEATKTVKKDLNKTVSNASKTETTTAKQNTNATKEQTNNETYYVQVGSFSNKPNDSFISIINKNGYTHKVVTSQNGSSKILIGPYSGREKASVALVKIKDRIN
ncbi:conserved hypothetical protein, partial [sediment metagenome]